jgi:hypothetical protein
MNRNKAMCLLSLVLVAGSALVTGCQSSRTALKVDPMPGVVRYTETLAFERDMQVPASPSIQNPDDPRQLVLFALSLSRLGRHINAGDFLSESAQKFNSMNNELAVTALASAANEYLLGGDMNKFRTAVRDLRRTANRYQYASFDEHTLALLTLGDVATGGTTPNELTPKPLKSLYATGAASSRPAAQTE